MTVCADTDQRPRELVQEVMLRPDLNWDGKAMERSEPYEREWSV